MAELCRQLHVKAFSNMLSDFWSQEKGPRMLNSRPTQLAMIVIATLVLVLAGLSRYVGSAGGSDDVFASTPASTSISGLRSNILQNTPAPVARLSPDMQPGMAAIHELGGSAYAWIKEDAVCVLMRSYGPGGCFAQFSKPVALYLWGDATGFTAGGVVPDSVQGLELITSDGIVPVSIAGNAFLVDLPVNTSIKAERITLSDGTVFVNPDPIELPPLGV
jgi:hypothetical protein